MYTGTMISDLMTAVERAEKRAEQKRIADEEELERMFCLEGPAPQDEQVLAGAA